MKKNLFIIFALTFVYSAKSQIQYKSNADKAEIYYENIIEFKDKTKKELHDLVKKYLAVNKFTIQ